MSAKVEYKQFAVLVLSKYKNSSHVPLVCKWDSITFLQPLLSFLVGHLVCNRVQTIHQVSKRWLLKITRKYMPKTSKEMQIEIIKLERHSDNLSRYVVINIILVKLRHELKPLSKININLSPIDKMRHPP